MTTLALTRKTGKIGIRWTTPPTPPLTAELDALAASLDTERFASSSWVASKVREIAKKARFLGARTAEEYDAREETLNAMSFSVRPGRRNVGHYEAWEIFDANGRVHRTCSDLFDAMMWIRDQY